ncbi:MAG TPA: hydroxylamine oxidase [Nitrospirae bacterium]|nr:hydroxylamine oxidase [Nitrospirota bacterium]
MIGKRVIRYVLIPVLLLASFLTRDLYADRQGPAVEKISPQTQACIGCHSIYTPGIVKDWLTGRHSRTTPQEALQKPKLERRMSAKEVPDNYAKYVVGCYECHSQNPDRHKDNFQHMGYRINVIVSPDDCKTCHPVEVTEYSRSKKAYAVKNLLGNPVYHTLVRTATGLKDYNDGKIITKDPSYETLHETCLGCHGTELKVRGMKKVKTAMGEIEVPDIPHWSNQGVGRINPDGSRGACTSCHPRHSFSIEIARKPYTCAQCHLAPDVPAWNVYKESKHGNIYLSRKEKWNFSAVPWTVGKDFTAPTCAACHSSLLVTPDGEVVAERTHDFGSRLWVRLFGLIYAHPQPRSGDTTIIKNRDGLPLPTTFMNEPASEYLITREEQERRKDGMKKICNTCHSTDWINTHFAKMDSTIKETNEMTLTATKLMMDAWKRGIEDNTNPFDEGIEKLWIKQWLFYSSSIRYASAMTGAPDYTSFKLGWWELSHNLQMMKDAIEMKSLLKEKKE